MASLNKVMIIGNLGTNPEMRFTPNGKAVTSFAVACNDKRGETEYTEWFNVVAWNKLAETCSQYLSKGQQVYVEGRQQTRTWTSNDDKPRHKVELIANTVLFLGKKSQREEANEPEINEGDAPF